MLILLDVSALKQNVKKTIANALRQGKFVVNNVYALDAITMKYLCWLSKNQVQDQLANVKKVTV